jgi:beta-galactosidase
LGAEAFCYWLWRQQRTGCELPHSALLSAWAKPGLGYESVKTVSKVLCELASLLTSTKPATAQVALTWSDRGRAFLQTEPLGNNGTYKVDYNTTIAEWHQLLLDCGFPRDLRFENAALDGLKLLITPAMPAVSEKFRNRIRDWVSQGGIWICGPLTGSRTTEHTVHTDAGLGALDTFAGVETVFTFPLTATNAIGNAFGLNAPLSGWCHAFRPVAAGTKVIGTFKSDVDSGLAFVTERKIGKGAVVMLGAQPQGQAGHRLLVNLVRHYAAQAGVRQRYESSSGTLVCPRVTAQGRTLWIAVNLDGKGGTVDLPRAAEDALSGAKHAAGKFKLGRFEHRALWV